MHLQGFFAAGDASIVGSELRLTDPAFGRQVVTELPTTIRLQVVIFFRASSPDEDLSQLQVGWARPGGDQTINLAPFLGIGPQFGFFHQPIAMDVYEEGIHTLLLYPSDAEGVQAVADYSFEVTLMPT